MPTCDKNERRAVEAAEKGLVMKRSLAILLLLIVGGMPTAASSAAIRPKQAIAQAKAEWLADIRAAAHSGDRSTRFPSPPREVLIKRIDKAAKLYGFRVVSIQMLHSLQDAPVIVISSDRKQSLARSTPKIIDLFDPRHPTRTNPSSYAYEAYFLVAQTTRDVPFLATFNRWRGPHAGGGQWAESETLYPFPHG